MLHMYMTRKIEPYIVFAEHFRHFFVIRYYKSEYHSFILRKYTLMCCSYHLDALFARLFKLLFSPRQRLICYTACAFCIGINGYEPDIIRKRIYIAERILCTGQRVRRPKIPAYFAKIFLRNIICIGNIVTAI